MKWIFCNWTALAFLSITNWPEMSFFCFPYKTILLIYMYIFMTMPYYTDYYSFINKLSSIEKSSPNIFQGYFGYYMCVERYMFYKQLIFLWKAYCDCDWNCIILWRNSDRNENLVILNLLSVRVIYLKYIWFTYVFFNFTQTVMKF